MTDAPHIPVLLDAILERIDPKGGLWIDGTMGAGGYTRALLDAGADHVIGIDRDPDAHDLAMDWVGPYFDRFTAVEGPFSEMDDVADAMDGVVLDLGVSSMQLDQADRGFSFRQDGPLDMRMSQDGMSAADIVNTVDAQVLADILYVYGEERASRRIASAIVKRREETPFETTLDLADVIAGQLPHPKPGQSHPATRSFQALRIAVNGEYEELSTGLCAAERVLRPGGILAVVTFHSVEDRMVKRFFQSRSGSTPGSRHAPQVAQTPAQFEMITRKAVGPNEAELANNPRARSAKLRIGRRTDAAALDQDDKLIGMPMLRKELKL